MTYTWNDHRRNEVRARRRREGHGDEAVRRLRDGAAARLGGRRPDVGEQADRRLQQRARRLAAAAVGAAGRGGTSYHYELGTSKWRSQPAPWARARRTPSSAAL